MGVGSGTSAKPRHNFRDGQGREGSNPPAAGPALYPPHQDTGDSVEPCPSIWGQSRGGKGKGWEGTTSGGCRQKQEGITTCKGKSLLIS